MVVDHRTYTLKPGTVPQCLKLFEEEGIAILSRHLGPPLGFYVTEIGPLNQIVHLWGYKDVADRARRREELHHDKDFLAYLPKVREFIVAQENKLLLDAPFMMKK
ncbi:MAG: NIPSNAP family protein [Alphaproteobacteria bacterium]